ncbi:MAG: hypothetical protein AB8C84_09670 [Oligoflexales bacterium]
MKIMLCLLSLLSQGLYAQISFHKKSTVVAATELASAIDIVSEPEDGLVHLFELFVDENYHVEGFIRTSSESRQEVALEDLNDRDVILADVEGKAALKLRCESCTPEQGGVAVLTYLYNGLVMSYREFSIELTRVNDRKWLLKDEDGKVIESLYLVSRKFMGHLIGIKEVLVNQTPEDLEFEEISVKSLFEKNVKSEKL